MIEISQTAPLNTVQDLGRFGYRRYGIGTAGAMDRLALAAGNRALGNAPGAAGVEFQLFPVTIRLREDGAIALTGADCVATLDGKAIPPWWVLPVKAGQTLKLSAPLRGARTYLCVGGGINVPEVLGSRSTQMRDGFGGLSGKPLSAGDVLAAGPHAPCRFRDPFGFGIEPPEAAIEPNLHDWAADSDVVLRVILASEAPQFDDASLKAFKTASWTVTAQSNRMGYRLAGPTLTRPDPTEMRSQAIVQGVVQVPPSGQPIVQLADGNSAGGYPKIAYILQSDLWRLAQSTPGRKLRFSLVSLDDAGHARKQVSRYLDDVARFSSYCRMQVTR
ncbi:biotin-dependent carboxyltransferase family protein [Bradyrhizobium sp. 61]|uniref:5-oxoprolinase subunit C family protein n=1 Tax=Bradyrhizobium sp. 61 TaxID=2782679 RepID=UPI001FFB100F|nr:biotin-dependent carboxyltransferase family protein [Bradyrhizobium sp. 61]MCK1281079.1 biotin-dependent carboxyltransferase family protein [Bradyrhizobium sp. 61]